MKVAIVPDLPGWACDTLADGIIGSVQGVEFAKFYPEVNWDRLERDFDVIYVVIPSYLPERKDYTQYRTSFLGGPSVEGQVKELEKRGIKVRVSCTNKSMISRLGNLAVERIYYTPAGVDLDLFRSQPREANGRFNCGWAGWASYLMNKQISHRRGNWVIQAWEELSFKLEVAGGLPEYAMQSEVFKMFFPRITCKTYRLREMPEFYKKIDVYLVPDKISGGPYPALEAGACGVPLVTTKCGLLQQFIENERHGLVVDTYEQFISAIKWMKENRKQRQEMGKNLREFIHKNLSWGVVGPAYWKDFLIGT